jgi:hypothetical protein
LKPGNASEQARRGPPGFHSVAKHSLAGPSDAVNLPMFAGHFGKGMFGKALAGLPGTHKPAQVGGGEDWTAEEAGINLSHSRDPQPLGAVQFPSIT